MGAGAGGPGPRGGGRGESQVSPVVLAVVAAAACRCPVGTYVGLLSRGGALLCVESPPPGCEDVADHWSCPRPVVLPWVVACAGVPVVDADGRGAHCEVVP